MRSEQIVGWASILAGIAMGSIPAALIVFGLICLGVARRASNAKAEEIRNTKIARFIAEAELAKKRRDELERYK